MSKVPAPPLFPKPRTKQERLKRDRHIRKLYRQYLAAKGFNVVQLGVMFGLTHQQVSNICKGVEKKST